MFEMHYHLMRKQEEATENYRIKIHKLIEAWILYENCELIESNNENILITWFN